MGQLYSDAENVEEMAKGLIANFHPDLASANIKYLYKEKASKKAGKPVFGSVRKMSDMLKHLTNGLDFVVEIPLEIWNNLDAKKRRALIDHLLERCNGEEDEQTGEMKWKVREPDVHEFGAILKRHGAWNEDLEGFCSLAQSLDLNFLISDDDEKDNSSEDTSSED